MGPLVKTSMISGSAMSWLFNQPSTIFEYFSSDMLHREQSASSKRKELKKEEKEIVEQLSLKYYHDDNDESNSSNSSRNTNNNNSSKRDVKYKKEKIEEMKKNMNKLNSFQRQTVKNILTNLEQTAQVGGVQMNHRHFD